MKAPTKYIQRKYYEEMKRRLDLGATKFSLLRLFPDGDIGYPMLLRLLALYSEHLDSNTEASLFPPFLEKSDNAVVSINEFTGEYSYEGEFPFGKWVANRFLQDENS